MVTYKDAGVDIDAGDDLVDRIGPLARRTLGPEVMAGVGGFASLVRVPAGMREPVLVSGTDGVGTKLLVAQAAGRHSTIGVDLVAMCVNDVLCTGARPLFFLDYFACGSLDVGVAEDVIRGIADGCRIAGCSLVGGETAELPGMYAPGEYDLAGFAVGVVERDEIVDGREVRPGDAIIGLPSTGLHSNGYSLARKVLWEDPGRDLGDELAGTGRSIADVLLEPTRIYVDELEAARRAARVKAIAHITGGGLPGNVPRVLPRGTAALLDRGSWEPPPVFRAIASCGVPSGEMDRTFNMGIGLVLVVGAGDEGRVLGALGEAGFRGFVAGRIVERAGEEPTVIL